MCTSPDDKTDAEANNPDQDKYVLFCNKFF